MTVRLACTYKRDVAKRVWQHAALWQHTHRVGADHILLSRQFNHSNRRFAHIESYNVYTERNSFNLFECFDNRRIAVSLRRSKFGGYLGGVFSCDFHVTSGLAIAFESHRLKVLCFGHPLKPYTCSLSEIRASLRDLLKSKNSTN